jgi:hypothetical protein
MFWSWAGWPSDKPLDRTGLIGAEFEVRPYARCDECMTCHGVQIISFTAGDRHVQRLDFQPDPMLLLFPTFHPTAGTQA